MRRHANSIEYDPAYFLCEKLNTLTENMVAKTLREVRPMTDYKKPQHSDDRIIKVITLLAHVESLQIFKECVRVCERKQVWI